MKRFEGSPAPWRINGVDYHDYGLIDAEGGEIMLLKAECEQDDHNASLIAAAPELLESLQLAEKAMAEGRNVTYPEWYGVINKARAAISKALGEG
ncbi:hypothetical protein ACSRQO_003934 [Enterobacter hormaechei]